MNLLSAESVSKSYDERWLFKDISFGVAKGDKVALVGSNGAGKSTLLKIMAGQVEPDNGDLRTRQGIAVGYLPQEPVFDTDQSIRDVIYSDDNLFIHTAKEYEDALLDPDFDADRMQDLLIRMDELNAWDAEKLINQVLGKLDIHNLDVKASSLSGGQKKRVALAQLILSSPQLILLDEPTNHLDLTAIEWLENFLNGQNITLVMVTHDRYFLDTVCNQIFELDRGKLYRHQGNYAYFLEKKSERETVHQVTVDKAKNLLKKELEWMRRQPRARGTKAKYRVEAFEDVKEKASQSLDKAELELNVGMARQGNKIIELHGIEKKFGEKRIVNRFDYVFRKKERVGIIGKNGTGKSTFLNMLTGKIPPDAGEVVPGVTTKIGYYTQETENLNPENRVIEEVKQIAEYVTLGNGEQVSVSRLLEMFLFPPAAQYTPVSKLSGGERRRLQLLKILVTNPNFLILDEPTNDLDIDTLNILEDFLDQFEGCMILVSHDRYFMDRLVQHLFVFEGDGKIKDFPGNYSDYRTAQEQVETSVPVASPPITARAEVAPVVKPTSAPAPILPKRKLSNKEQREYEQLEGEIEQLENKKNNLVGQLNAGSDSHTQLTAWAREIEEINSLVEQKTLRWLELSE